MQQFVFRHDGNVMFIFGAGASYGSGDVWPEPPPVGQRLFSELQKIPNSVAAGLEPDLAQLFSEKFEDGMAAFAKRCESNVGTFQGELAKYLLRFRPGGRNAYRTLLNLVLQYGVKPIFVTTNYDLILDRVILSSGLGLWYGPVPTEAHGVPLLKVHGSCNFLPHSPGWDIQAVHFENCDTHFEGPIRAARSAKEVMQFVAKNTVLAPVLAIYAASKHVYQCPRAIRHLQDSYKRHIETVDRVYVIGLRVNPLDTHIWSPLADSDVPLSWVGFEGDEFQAWVEKTGRTNAKWIGRQFDAALPFIAQDLRDLVHEGRTQPVSRSQSSTMLKGAA